MCLMACRNWTHKASPWNVFYSRVQYVKSKSNGKFFPVKITKAYKECNGITAMFPDPATKRKSLYRLRTRSLYSGEGDTGTAGTKDSVRIWRIQDLLHLT